ncbi:hypothetical protein B0H10DRAFT_1967952 [Mycena sp. CBHHK59/15]|nr:hypothetical protein B0H10DRAFT_1967952 [Mycena sp. CBHHK59/15]
MAQNSSTATTALSPEEELQALIANVAQLAKQSVALTKMCRDLQEELPGIIARIARPRPSTDAIFVRGVPKAPVQVELETRSAQDGNSIAWYVVWIGREPGLYASIEDADVQVKGCPNQQYRRKTGKREALQFYAQLYEGGKVEKWTEASE